MPIHASEHGANLDLLDGDLKGPLFYAKQLEGRNMEAYLKKEGASKIQHLTLASDVRRVQKNMLPPCNQYLPARARAAPRRVTSDIGSRGDNGRSICLPRVKNVPSKDRTAPRRVSSDVGNRAMDGVPHIRRMINISPSKLSRNATPAQQKAEVSDVGHGALPSASRNNRLVTSRRAART